MALRLPPPLPDDGLFQLSPHWCDCLKTTPLMRRPLRTLCLINDCSQDRNLAHHAGNPKLRAAGAAGKFTCLHQREECEAKRFLSRARG